MNKIVLTLLLGFSLSCSAMNNEDNLFDIEITDCSCKNEHTNELLVIVNLRPDGRINKYAQPNEKLIQAYQRLKKEDPTSNKLNTLKLLATLEKYSKAEHTSHENIGPEWFVRFSFSEIDSSTLCSIVNKLKATPTLPGDVTTIQTKDNGIEAEINYSKFYRSQCNEQEQVLRGLKVLTSAVKIISPVTNMMKPDNH